MFLGFKSEMLGHHGAATVLTAGFALGILAAAAVGLLSHGRVAAASAVPPAALPAEPGPVGYPVAVIRVLDGDTFEARVRVWPGLEITTKVRLRGIDAPEQRARCPEERIMAEAARTALSGLLAQGQVGISGVGLDKYGGRVIADASARNTASVAEALLAAGHARRYGGGRRGSWCSRPPSWQTSPR